MSMSSTNPSQIFGGKWVEIGQGRVLMGRTDVYAAGTTVNSGLPNITGGAFALGHTNNTSYGFNTKDANWHGAFAPDGQWPAYNFSSANELRTDTNHYSGFDFSANRVNSIYGSSSIVQPPALFCYMFQRTE